MKKKEGVAKQQVNQSVEDHNRNRRRRHQKEPVAEAAEFPGQETVEDDDHEDICC